MRKVVFEGTINGKTFDNVQDYNNEMQRLLSDGELNIQASSNTRVVNEPEENKGIGGRLSPKEFDPNDFLPFFNNASETYYLDLLVSSDDRLNDKNLTVAEDRLSGTLENLREAIRTRSLDLEDAFAFVNILKEIRSRIYEDAETNRNTAQEVTERISSDTARLKLLQNAKPIIATVSEYYDNAFTLVKEYLLNL